MASPLYRIGIAGFLHESNTFSAEPTPYEAFAENSLTRGEAMRRRWHAVRHELGGMLAAAGDSAVPLYATFAVPSGAIAAEAFDRIAAELLAEIRQALPLDGLLLALHGATVAANAPDADGEILQRVRQLTGPALPIVITFDLHANLSQRMIALSTAAIGYRRNPHLDQYERGEEAARLIQRILAEGIRPTQALESPPMIIRNSRQHTDHAPARGLYEDLAEVLMRPGILTASVAMGFPHADVAEMGPGFLAVATSEIAARAAARWMAQRAWDRREDFCGPLTSVQAAVRAAAQATHGPVVLLDTGDNVGGGSSARSTVLLDEVLRQGVRGALIVLHDPATVNACIAAGVRNEVTLESPSLSGRVRVIADGLFEETQVRHGGWSRFDQGLTAVVETDQDHTIVLTSRRMAPFSLEQLISLGIHPERKRVLIVKGVIAPRAAYDPVARETILVDTPGATADDPASLPYRNRRRPMYPLERGAGPWPPAAS